ncbi:MAG: CopD family protein [Dehalococcoidales bacterium]|nr:CopD family protein [Dehalococcoidales bacterium]
MNTITIRFTHLVWWCIGILALTGVLTTWIHVPSPETVTGTTYGIILIIKVVIAAGMIACNAIINIGLARRSRRDVEDVHTSTRTASQWAPGHWVSIASRVSLALAFLMMASIATLVEFDRSFWSVALNFLRLSALTIWFGATAFLPLVLVPSLAGVGGATLTRLSTGILSRFSLIAIASAIAAISGTVLTILKNLKSPPDLWSTGHGIVTLLELLTLFVMALVMLRGKVGLSQARKTDKYSADFAVANMMARAARTANANVVLGIAALFFSSLAGILYYPRDSVLSGEIPMATSSISFDLFEPLGYVVAAAVSIALIWYFGVVEGKVSRQETNEET